MKKILLAIFLLLFISNLNAQETISKTDSIHLCKTFNKLIKSIETKNRKIFLNICIENVDCNECSKNNLNQKNDLISKYKLFDNHFKNFTNSLEYTALKKRGFTLNKSFQLYKGMKVLFYEVFIPTILNNEIEKNREGKQDVFQFIKVKNEFKLCGLSTIP